jgi:hypothetical protein
MGRYVINDIESKAIKKIIKKFSNRDICQLNSRLRGSFTITNFRKYPIRHEVDIEFKGELKASTGVYSGTEWFKSEIYGQQGISKIKVNKLIKRHIFQEVKQQAAYFGIEIKFIDEIKKIKWL